jgi:HNH endonuclease
LVPITMPRCLFCLRESDELTAEHVFPAALGGSLVVRGTCIECVNDKKSFSKEFEQPFAVELAPLRNILVIPDRYSKIPSVAVKAEVNEKELDAKVLGDGTVRLTPVVTVIRGEDGGVKEIVFEHVTDRKKEDVRREAAEKGYELIESEPCAEQKAEVSMSGTLKLIGEPEGLRLATKIAYTGFALRLKPDFAIRNTSNVVRTYVRTGDGTPSSRLFLNEEYFANCAQGPHQHSIVIVGRKNKHRIDAIVRLFCGLSYFVTLSEQYDGADFYDTLVYDAQRGDINGVLVGHLQSEFLQIEHVETSKATVWNDRVASGNWLMKFIDGEIKSKLRAAK